MFYYILNTTTFIIIPIISAVILSLVFILKDPDEQYALISKNFFVPLFLLAFGHAFSLDITDIEIMTIFSYTFVISLFLTMLLKDRSNNPKKYLLISSIIMTAILISVNIKSIDLLNNLNQTAPKVALIILITAVLYLFKSHLRKEVWLNLTITFAGILVLLYPDIENYVFIGQILIFFGFYRYLMSEINHYNGKLESMEDQYINLKDSFDDELRKAVNERTFFIEEKKERIAEQSKIDVLTRVYNNKALREIMDKLIVDDTSFSIIMFDIDDFKRINDNLGHTTGDKALKIVSHISKSKVRDGDYVTRYGGDEFVIVLPGSSIKQSHLIAERIRTDVVKMRDPRMTVSMGLSNYPDDGQSFEALINAADDGLYYSKHKGKNTISYYRDEKQGFDTANGLE